LKGFFILTVFLAVVGFSQAEDIHFGATNLWKLPLGRYCQSSAALDTSGVIYLICMDGRLFAINPDGTKRWEFNSHFESVSTPAVGSGGHIYFGSRNHQIYAVTPTGKKKWGFKTGGWVDASPALGADGTVYLGSWDKKFYAITPDGSKRWEFVAGGPIVSSAAVDAAGVIYFGSHDRKFYALNPDGTKRWEYAAGGPITSSPAIGSNGEIYFTSVNGRFHALNADGNRRWDLQTGGISSSSPVIGPDGTIYVSVNQTHWAITPDGKQKWQRGFWNPEPGYFGETAAAVLANDTVVFTGGDGFVMTVPAAVGDKDWFWNYYLYGPGYCSPLVATNGTIYVNQLSGELHALKRSAPLAQSPWPTARGNSQRTGRVTNAP